MLIASHDPIVFESSVVDRVINLRDGGIEGCCQMIFHPSILALYVSSILIAFMVFYSAFYGVQILRRWDIESGSEAAVNP